MSLEKQKDVHVQCKTTTTKIVKLMDVTNKGTRYEALLAAIDFTIDNYDSEV